MPMPLDVCWKLMTRMPMPLISCLMLLLMMALQLLPAAASAVAAAQPAEPLEDSYHQSSSWALRRKTAETTHPEWMDPIG